MFDLLMEKRGDNAKPATALQAMDGTLADISSGIISGTKVATTIGWRPVEAIAAGDMVLTFDGGLQPVAEVRRRVVWGGGREDHRHWPLHVPAGAMGNARPMLLLPDQTVLVESDAAEELTGDPFALIPARALDGFRGIAPAAPAMRLEIVQLAFETDEIVFANVGALVYCPADFDILAAIRRRIEAGGRVYEVMDFDTAETLVTLMEIDEAGGPEAEQARLSLAS